MLRIMLFLLLSIVSVLFVAIFLILTMIFSFGLSDNMAIMADFLYFGLLLSSAVATFGWPQSFLGGRIKIPNIVLAVIGGLTLSLPSMVFTTWLVKLYPWLSFDGLQLITADIQNSWMMIALVCLVAPTIEEIIFRGYIWRSLDRYSFVFRLLMSSFVFSMFHIEPIHIIGVFPMAIWLGWIRSKSNTIYESIAAHIASNVMAVFLITYAPTLDLDCAQGWIAAANTLLAGLLIGRKR